MSCNCHLREKPPHQRNVGTILYWLRKFVPDGMVNDINVQNNITNHNFMLYFHDRLVGKVSFAEVILDKGKSVYTSVYTPIFTFLGPFKEWDFEKKQLEFWVNQHLHLVANQVAEFENETL